MAFMMKVGIGCQLIGVLLLLNAGQSITGFVIVESLSPSFSGIVGLLFLLGGIGITIWHHKTYDSYELPVRTLLGDARYEQLPEKDQMTTLKSYRRQIGKLEREIAYQSREEARRQRAQGLPYELVFTESFQETIEGHPRKRIDSTLRKLAEGKGNRKILQGEQTKGKGIYEIKTDTTGRIYYRVEGKKIVLLEYDSDKSLMGSKRRQNKLAQL